MSIQDRPNVPVLVVVKLDPDESLNHEFPLPGVNFEELFIVIGEMPSSYPFVGNGHYILYRWMANGTNSPGMLRGQYHIDRFKYVDPDEDL